MTAAIRPARAGDAEAIFGLVMALAQYERLDHAVASTPADLNAALFGPAPRVFCDLAEEDGQAVGLALWFYNFSTFAGCHGIYLEDLFVRPEARGRGTGRRLIAGLAARCVDENLGRLEWAVLDWNAPAIAFYRARGADILDDWRICRISGARLASLAGEAG